MILKRGDREVTYGKQSQHLFILKSVIETNLTMVASTYKR